MPEFGDILRGLGSVLNPQVAQQVAAEQAGQDQMRRQLGVLLVQKQLEQQSPEYQAKVEALKNDQGYREAVKGIDISDPANWGKLASAASQFGKPDVAAGYVKAHEDRAARLQTAADNLQLRRETLAQNERLALERITDQRERDRVQAEFRQQQLRLQEQIAQANQEMRRMGLGIQQQLADAKTSSAGVGKPLPASASAKLMENYQNLRRAERAGQLLDGLNPGAQNGDKEATGFWKGLSPDWLLQRTDPQGIDTRAALADLGSLVIHERSGAAVTAAEYPRLKPFIPQTGDSPETARKKVQRFKDVYQEIVNDTRDYYKEQGFNVPEFTSAKAAAAPAAPAANVPPPPPGFFPVKS